VKEGEYGGNIYHVKKWKNEFLLKWGGRIKENVGEGEFKNDILKEVL
jgi:hypothetical protein